MLSEVLPEARLCRLLPEVLMGEHRGTPLGKPSQELMQGKTSISRGRKPLLARFMRISPEAENLY